MAAAVLVPFSSTEPWRRRARDHIVGWYQTQGYDVVEGACNKPWRKAVAVAEAADRTDADVFVVADADCLCGDGVAAALAEVEAGAAWAIPHHTVHRLDQAATEAVYAGTAPAATTRRVQHPYKGFAGGGIVVLTRALWEQVPLDPRFEGWGGEDSSWALALTCLAGPPARLGADLYHLWHPPPERMSRRWGSRESRVLEIRYIRAARSGRPAPQLMADIVAEARDALEWVAA